MAFIVMVKDKMLNNIKNNYIMKSVELKSVRKGDFFRFKDSEKAPLWIRCSFERISKKYSCISYDDSCHELLRKGTVKVFVEDYVIC